MESESRDWVGKLESVARIFELLSDVFYVEVLFLSFFIFFEGVILKLFCFF